MSQDSTTPAPNQPLATSRPLTYEPPQLRELGSLATLTLGSAGDGADAVDQFGSLGPST